MKVSTFRDLMNGHDTAEISCLYTGKLVRKLKMFKSNGDIYWVEVDSTIGPAGIVRVHADTPITYEPWMMDRGSMLFAGDETGKPEFAGKSLKICGEGDPIVFGDGTRDTIEPN